jgi:putative tryptophan/tyrosine transport system substrate-binding protein
MMDRRRFLLTSLAGVVAAPLGATAEQAGKPAHIGYIAGASRDSDASFIQAFREGLREHGYTEGRDIVIEYRWADGKAERLPELAADLVGRRVDLIVALSPQPTLAAQRATRTIPIVTIAGDPVALGLAASLARPGGNVTGIATYGPELVGKNLELLKNLLPTLKRVGIFWIPANPNHVRSLKDVEETARSFAIQILPLKIVSPGDFEDAFRTAVTEHAGAVWIFGEPLFTLHRARLAALASDARLPTMFLFREHVEVGGLVSYGPDNVNLFRRTARYVDKILKGAKPGDLPIEQPTKFELVINMKTAKALGLTIPPSVLARADQVIE